MTDHGELPRSAPQQPAAPSAVVPILPERPRIDASSYNALQKKAEFRMVPLHLLRVDYRVRAREPTPEGVEAAGKILQQSSGWAADLPAIACFPPPSDTQGGMDPRLIVIEGVHRVLACRQAGALAFGAPSEIPVFILPCSITGIQRRLTASLVNKRMRVGREGSFLDDVLCCVDLLQAEDTNEFSGFGFAMGKTQKEQIKKFAKKIVLCPGMTESLRKLTGFHAAGGNIGHQMLDAAFNEVNNTAMKKMGRAVTVRSWGDSMLKHLDEIGLMWVLEARAEDEPLFMPLRLVESEKEFVRRKLSSGLGLDTVHGLVLDRRQTNYIRASKKKLDRTPERPSNRSPAPKPSVRTRRQPTATEKAAALAEIAADARPLAESLIETFTQRTAVELGTRLPSGAAQAEPAVERAGSQSRAESQQSASPPPHPITGAEDNSGMHAEEGTKDRASRPATDVDGEGAGEDIAANVQPDPVTTQDVPTDPTPASVLVPPTSVVEEGSARDEQAVAAAVQPPSTPGAVDTAPTNAPAVLPGSPVLPRTHQQQANVQEDDAATVTNSDRQATADAAAEARDQPDTGETVDGPEDDDATVTASDRQATSAAADRARAQSDTDERVDGREDDEHPTTPVGPAPSGEDQTPDRQAASPVNQDGDEQATGRQSDVAVSEDDADKEQPTGGQAASAADEDETDDEQPSRPAAGEIGGGVAGGRKLGKKRKPPTRVSARVKQRRGTQGAIAGEASGPAPRQRSVAQVTEAAAALQAKASKGTATAEASSSSSQPSAPRPKSAGRLPIVRVVDGGFFEIPYDSTKSNIICNLEIHTKQLFGRRAPAITRGVGYGIYAELEPLSASVGSKLKFRAKQCLLDDVKIVNAGTKGLGLAAAEDLPEGHRLPLWGMPVVLHSGDEEKRDKCNNRTIDVVTFVHANGKESTISIQGAYMCPATYCNSADDTNAEFCVGSAQDWVAVARIAQGIDTEQWNNLDILLERLTSVAVVTTQPVSAGEHITIPYDWEQLPDGPGFPVAWDLDKDEAKLEYRSSNLQ